ncbi:MAG: Flp pilus assembly complex ATPase component TadA [Ruminococcus sp.]|nr:Flp pilus assembly complex ATPase component TadA [Ruminococcus sp.]
MECENKGWTAAISQLPRRLSAALEKHTQTLSQTCYEIILRVNRPLTLETSLGRYYLSDNGCLVSDSLSQKTLIITRDDIQSTYLKLCSYSVYSFQREINNGYITIGEGCRAGICGTAVMTDGKITSVKHISSINIRIARERVGCSDELLKRVDPLKGVLICGAPSSGKTTILRDMARALSFHNKVSLIDERSELSASVDGCFQNDIGLCDVYVGYPKDQAILQAIRGMSPDIIACDELGGEKESEAIRYALFSGAAFIATVHGVSAERKIVKGLLDTGAFSYLVTLSQRRNPGQIEEIQCLS